jgi:hypothetical protein
MGGLRAVPEMSYLSEHAIIKATPIIVTPWRFVGYKYSTRLALLSHLELLHFSLKVFPFFLHFFTMGVKRGIKCSHVYVSVSSSSSSDALTPPSSPTGSLPPPASSLEGLIPGAAVPNVQAWQALWGFPMVDLSSGEEDTFPDTSRDEEIAWKLFGNLNRGLLGPPGDDNFIVLSDSDKEKEVREDDRTDSEAAPSSVGDSPAPIAFTADDDDAPNGVQDDSNGGSTPDRVQGDCSADGDKASTH